jgi:hypothetical protein
MITNCLEPRRVSPGWALLILCCLLSWPATDVYAIEYYVSPQGNDASAGTSTAEAWRTIERANRMRLMAGDRLLFQADATFQGTVEFTEGDGGDPDEPVVVSSYGTGQAVIEAGTNAGLTAHNVAGLTVHHLAFRGNGSTTNGADGIVFYNDLPGDRKLAHVHIDEVEVSGFGKNGISIGAWNGASGYRDVEVKNGSVHDNKLNGLIIYGPQRDVHEDVYVGHVRAYRNSGQWDIRPNSGSGIVMGNTLRGTIEDSVAHDNGWMGVGSVGIWSYESRMITIQHNESFKNRTTGRTDGGGFDLDGGMVDSIMHDNFSHDNDGAGFGLYQYRGASTWERNVVRGNVSLDDGRKNSHAGIQAWNEGNGLRDADIHENLIVTRASREGRPSAVYLMTETQGFSFHGNTFVVGEYASLIRMATTQECLQFYGNHYWPSAAPEFIHWGDAIYHSVETWIEGARQEDRRIPKKADNNWPQPELCSGPVMRAW